MTAARAASSAHALRDAAVIKRLAPGRTGLLPALVMLIIALDVFVIWALTGRGRDITR